MLGPIILDSNAPDWIICGGESGPTAHDGPAMGARSARRRAPLRRKFFMKQMTGKKPIPTTCWCGSFRPLR
jgi:protein gp37